MKKRLKKMLAVVCLLTLIFTFSVRPKKADASLAGLTAAGVAAAAGIPLSTALLGIGGLVAVGAAIYYQDDIVSVGQKMAGQIALKGLLTSDFVDEEAGTVTLNGDLVDAAAGAVYSMPKVRSVANSLIFDMSIPMSTNNPFPIIAEVNMPILDKLNNVDTFKFSVTISNPLSRDAGNYLYLYSASGALLSQEFFDIPKNGSKTHSTTLAVKASDMPVTAKTYWWGDATTVTKFVVADLTVPTVEEVNKTVENAPTTINDMQSYAYTNNVTNNTMTINPTQDMTGATVNDLYQTSYDNLNESILQTGILTKIWNGITSIPSSIAAAGVAASTAINTKMTDLWEDAGAIWTGMSDSLINIKADVNAKIGALQDAMAGGIDNIRTDIGAMMDNLRTGIDSLATSAAANMASWGQLTLDGIDAGIGAITSGLTNVWTKTTTAIETAATATTTAINTGIGTITDGLTTITDWIIGFPAMFYSWFVPPDFSFLGPLITKATNDLEDKFGTLPSLEDIGSAITIQEKSIYDIEITLMGNNYKIVPIALKPTIDWARPFLTAAVNLTSITFLIHRNKRELFK